MALVGLSLIDNDKPRMAQNKRNLCGTIASGDILSCCGGSCFIQAQDMGVACCLATFLAILASICAIACGSKAEAWGPQSIAACICFIVHGCPVLMEQPFVTKFRSLCAAGFFNAKPWGNMLFQYAGVRPGAGRDDSWPVCIVHQYCGGWRRCFAIHHRFFSLCRLSMMVAVTGIEQQKHGRVRPSGLCWRPR